MISTGYEFIMNSRRIKLGEHKRGFLVQFFIDAYI
jgi:hypothetical protein